MNLNTPTINAGPLTAADLDAARKHSTGNVWLLPRRASMDPHGNQWPETLDMEAERAGWLESCAPEGGIARDPIESMHRHRATASTVRWGLALAALVAVLGYVARVVWPL